VFVGVDETILSGMRLLWVWTSGMFVTRGTFRVLPIVGSSWSEM